MRLRRGEEPTGIRRILILGGREVGGGGGEGTSFIDESTIDESAFIHSQHICQHIWEIRVKLVIKLKCECTVSYAYYIYNVIML